MSVQISIANNEDDSLSLNMTNANFYTFMRALGFENITPENEHPDFGVSFDCGQIHPATLYTKLETFFPELAIRNDVQTGNVYSCGLGLEKIDRYLSKMKAICQAASKMEKMICWG